MSTITLSRSGEKKIESIAGYTGISRDDVLENAISYYSSALQKEIDLKRELNLWEEASSLDLAKFEKTL